MVQEIVEVLAPALLRSGSWITFVQALFSLPPRFRLVQRAF